MIDLTIHENGLQNAVRQARERNIVIPTFQQMIHPDRVPAAVQRKLKRVGLWEIDPVNLFRINWHNEPKEQGGGFGGVNFMEIPRALSGVSARIVALVGKWFPTGAHKVGASFGCLVPRLVTGQFDPTLQKAVWPSTGNFCRGGAYDSALLGCDSIAILPEEMSRERFEWLSQMVGNGEVIATPGCESNVKEIYDKCWELRRTRDDIVIFNQFEEFGNYLWHYAVTGAAMAEVFGQIAAPRDRVAGLISATGSAGTIASGDYLKQQFATCKIAAVEALQCPTLLLNGYGGHRIEGIGDKHVPWIHNVRNTDMVIAVDDEFPMRLLRLLNEPAGKYFLSEKGVPDEVIARLPLIGISGLGNLVAAIKFARYYELTEKDLVFTVFTDSMDLYGSRLEELREAYGKYTREDAIRDFYQYLRGITTDNLLELSFRDRRRIHNLKYFTWIEQQGKDVAELDAQWYDYDTYWPAIQQQVAEIDARIGDFNRRVAAKEE